MFISNYIFSKTKKKLNALNKKKKKSGQYKKFGKLKGLKQTFYSFNWDKFWALFFKKMFLKMFFFYFMLLVKFTRKIEWFIHDAL